MEERLINAQIGLLLNTADKTEFKKDSKMCSNCSKMLCVDFSATSYCPIFLVKKAKKMAMEKL